MNKYILSRQQLKSVYTAKEHYCTCRYQH